MKDPDSKNKPVCKCFDDDDKMPKKIPQAILTAVTKAMEDDVPYASVEELFESLHINQSIFEEAYRKIKTKNKVVFKRGVNEVWINQYSKQLLKCWNANMDISFVTDAYAVIIYIILYITKAEREIGLLLSMHKKKQQNKEISPLKKL